MSKENKKSFARIESMDSLLTNAKQKVADDKKDKKDNLIKDLVVLLDKMQECDITLEEIKIIVDSYIAGQITEEE